MPEFTVRPARWNEDQAAIAALRRAVFIEEQSVPEALEWETVDAQCRWWLAETPVEGVVGIVRLLDSGRIGRLAVRQTWRRKGVGTALLNAVLAAARRSGMKDIYLCAQTQALDFYARHGFSAEGPEYLDAGIPHRTMWLVIAAP